MSFWGPLFPDYAGRSRFWGPHFPDGAAPADVIPGTGPAGAAAFALDLESGAQLTMSWDTDVFKAYDGSEHRRSKWELPKLEISGQAYLVGSAARATRARLARYAAIGVPFLLGLSYEELTVIDDSTGPVLPVSSTADIDWAVLGQRVIVQRADEFIQGVIQGVAADSLTIDVDPGDIGIAGARVMPSAAIYLDPKQPFARFPNPDGLERWAIKGQPATFGFESEPRAAFVSLSSTSGVLTTAVVQLVATGAAGNAFTLTMVDGGPDDGSLGLTGSAYTFSFHSGVTTVANLASILALFGLQLNGTYTPSDVITAVIDELAVTSFAGGSDRSWGLMGTSAELVIHDGRPVWDRVLQLDTSATDSVQAMNEILDLGGVLRNIGSAKQADWGRQVLIRSDLASEWQWFKLFTFTVRGRARAWWLSTWREDLDAVSIAAGKLTVAGPSIESGDFFAWYPLQRTHLQTIEDDGTVTLLKITSAVDNGDGTITLDVSTDDGMGGMVAASLSSLPTMVSWLELCRFDEDKIVVTFAGSAFTVDTKSRVVQQ